MSERYIRQIQVPEIGQSGQEKLAKGKILVVGAGGLAMPVISYLVAGGIGNIAIVDGDKVEISNLNRQIIYSVDDIGKAKPSLLAAKLSKQNPEVIITPFNLLLNEENAREIIGSYDLVCDCTDNARSRALIDGVCHSLSKPLVYAAVKDWEGYVTVLHYRKKIGLAEIFPDESTKNTNTPHVLANSVVNTTCGIVGSIQATEAIKIILGLKEVLDGMILCVNSLTQTYKKYKIRT